MAVRPPPPPAATLSPLALGAVCHVFRCRSAVEASLRRGESRDEGELQALQTKGYDSPSSEEQGRGPGTFRCLLERAGTLPGPWGAGPGSTRALWCESSSGSARRPRLHGTPSLTLDVPMPLAGGLTPRWTRPAVRPSPSHPGVRCPPLIPAAPPAPSPRPGPPPSTGARRAPALLRFSPQSPALSSL